MSPSFNISSYSEVQGVRTGADYPQSNDGGFLSRLNKVPRGELYIFALLIVSAKTVIASVAVIDIFASIILAATIFLAVLDTKNFRLGLLFSSLTLTIFLFGVGVSFLTSPQIWPPDNLVSTASVIFAGSFVVCSQRQMFNSASMVWHIALLMIGYLAISVITGGLTFDFPPRYNFEVFNEFGVQQYIVYSQGVSKLAAMATLPCIFFASQRTSITRRIGLLLLGILFAINSFIGGARGEFLALLICLVLMMLGRNKMIFFVIMLAALAALTAMPALQVDGYVQIDRLTHLWQDETLGGRQQLFGDAIFVLTEKPQCMIAGCGFQYFQFFWGEVGNAYPHNFILDFSISVGIFLTGLIYFIYFKSTFAFLSSPGLQLNAYVLLYLFLVSMKSGTPSSDHIFWIFLSLQIMSVRHPQGSSSRLGVT